MTRNDQVASSERAFRSWASLKARHLPSSDKVRSFPRSPSSASAFEQGVPLPEHRSPLSRSDLSLIFHSSRIDGTQGLRLLQVLQGRRVNGTLDLPLPYDLAKLASQDGRLITDALSYLRYKYPADEDAAILRRIQAEEVARAKEKQLENEERFQPQSGEFGESRGTNDSVFGTSVLDQWRQANKEKGKLLEEEENRMIDELDTNLKREGRSGGLVAMEKQDLALGRPITTEDVKQNLYLRWKLTHSLKAMSHITPEQIADMNWVRRLLPSAIFTVLFSLGMYWFSEAWYEPNRLDRLWPNTPIAAATISALIIANATIFALWKIWPPAWKILNRYFITTPGYPYALSMLGNTFSHQGLRHLAVNMILLWIVGIRFHEDVGRGTFLAIYLSSGVIASFVGMSVFALTRVLSVSSSGASGCLTGMMGAWLTIHSE